MGCCGKLWDVLVMALALLAGLWVLFLYEAVAEGLPPLPPVCHDHLAIQFPKYPVRAVAKELRRGACAGSLDWTFNTRLRPVRRLLATETLSLYRVHLLNGPGLRNGQLGPYEPHFGHTVKTFNALWERGGGTLRTHLAARARAYCRLFEKYPGVLLEISPTLEHNLSARAFRHQAAVVREACPSAVVVENPVGGVPASGRHKVERHGLRPGRLRPPFNLSFDGVTDPAANFVGYWVRHVDADATFWWHESYNCRRSDGPFVDPRKRTACPSARDVRRYYEWYASP